MRNICILLFLIFLSSMLYGQSKADYGIDGVQLSTVEYLIVIKNNTGQSLFLPVDPIVQKCNDTLFVNAAFSYQHQSSKVYKYTIGGISFDTNSPLSDYIKPDTAYKISVGYIPNFAVPSSLFELKPHSVHSYRIFNSLNQYPNTVAFSIFIQNKVANEYKQMIFGEIISGEVSKR